MAVVALVLGLIGFLNALIPFLVFLAWGFGVAALVLGLVGRQRAKRSPEAGRKTMATWGAGLGIASLVVGAAWVGFFAYRVYEDRSLDASDIEALDSGESALGTPGDPSKIKIERTMLRYLPSQEGGHYHIAAVLVRNTSDKVAIDVGGQLSIKDADGELVETVEPTQVNVLPGGQALLHEDALDLPKPVENGRIEAELSVAEMRDAPPAGSKSPVSFSNLSYSPASDDGFEACQIRGKVANTFTKPHEHLQLRAAGYSKGQLTMAGFTYVDKVFPKSEAMSATPQY